jgi:hypothetical protein
MSIYQPYFYIIQDKRNGMYYAGAKWARDANPDKFMVEGGYTTRSNTINSIIQKYGIDIFIIRKIRLFNTAEEVQNYETKFLRKINARKHKKFYNGHNNDGAMDTMKTKIILFELYGVSSALQSPELQEKRRNTNIRKYGNPNYNNIEKIKSTNLERYGVLNSFQSKELRDKSDLTKQMLYGNPNYNNIEKIKSTNLERYGVEYTLQTEEVKQQSKITKQMLYGDVNYNNREKAKETWKLKYGFNHPNKTDKNRQILKDAARIREDNKSSRKSVLLIREYQKIYGKNLGLGRAWFRKSDEHLDKLVRLLINKFGELCDQTSIPSTDA